MVTVSFSLSWGGTVMDHQKEKARMIGVVME
jgi:hypothetical protein